MKLKWIWFAVGMILTAIPWIGFLTDASDNFSGTFVFLAITAAGLLLGWLVRYWNPEIWK